MFYLLHSGQWDWSARFLAIMFCAGKVSLSFECCQGDSGAVITLHRVFFFASVHAHYLSIHIDICVCQEYKIPIWWIDPSIASCDFLLCYSPPPPMGAWVIPQTASKTTVWLRWLCLSSGFSYMALSGPDTTLYIWLQRNHLLWLGWYLGTL